MQLWNACEFGWRRVTGVFVGNERVIGDEAFVKCFRLGFGQCISTASRRECVLVECVAVITEGSALVRELELSAKKYFEPMFTVPSVVAQ